MFAIIRFVTVPDRYLTIFCSFPQSLCLEQGALGTINIANSWCEQRKAEGAGAAQPGEEILRGNLIPECPCVQGGAEQGPGSAPGPSNGTRGTGRN